MTQRLLIVDDHEGFRRTARRTLARQGWTVVGEARDGATGLECADRLSPEVVLLDIGLPDMSGLDVAEQLHRTHPDIAIVMISTQERGDYDEIASDRGARGFLSKMELSGPALEELLAQ